MCLPRDHLNYRHLLDSTVINLLLNTSNSSNGHMDHHHHQIISISRQLLHHLPP